MSYGDVCKNCGHYRDFHDEQGKCQFSHHSINNGAVCDCSDYVLRDDLAEFWAKRKKEETDE